jgi:hypothetical protein
MLYLMFVRLAGWMALQRQDSTSPARLAWLA